MIVGRTGRRARVYAHGEVDGVAIELGEHRWDEEEAVAAWRRPRWLGLWARSLALAVVVLAGLPAAAPTTSRVLADPLWTIPAGTQAISLGSNAVIVTNQANAIGHDPLTGTELWRHALPAQNAYVLDTGAGVAAILVSEPGPGVGRETTTQLLVAERTGTVISRTSGSTAELPTAVGVSASGDRIVLQGRTEPGAPECLTELCTVVLGVAVSDGATAWRYTATPREEILFSIVDGRVGGIASVAIDGKVTFIDPFTGSTTGGMTVNAGQLVGAVLTPEHLVLVEAPGDRAVVSTYGLDLGDLVWQTTLALRPQPTPWAFALACGGDVCIETSGGLTVLDSATGRIEGTLPPRVLVHLASGAVVSLSGDGPGGEPTVVIRDGAGGSVITELAKTTIIEWVDSGDRALLVRLGARTSDILLVDGPGRVRSLGTLPEWTLRCQARGELLACANQQGGWWIWRLPL